MMFIFYMNITIKAIMIAIRDMIGGRLAIVVYISIIFALIF